MLRDPASWTDRELAEFGEEFDRRVRDLEEELDRHRYEPAPGRPMCPEVAEVVHE